MIRGTFDPTLHFSDQPLAGTEGSEFKRSLEYLSNLGSKFYYASVGCKKLSAVACLSSVATPLDKIMGSMARAAQGAGFAVSAGALLIPAQEGPFELNLSKAQQALAVTEKGINLATWLAEIKGVSQSVKMVSTVSSTGLAIALLIPIIDLVIHLREEGLKAFSTLDCMKTLYKIGTALLSVYLFMAAATLCAHVQLAITGAGITLSLL